jgi:hypothetical protein
MKTKSLIFLATILMASFIQAQTATLQIRTVLGNDQGNGTNGMFWGVLVDTTGNGFEVTPTGTITAFDFTTDGAFGADNYFAADSATATFAPFGGVGVASNVSSLSLSGGVDTGDAFGIFWSDGAGHYGFVTESGATLPSAGSNSNYSGTFSGDPYTAGGTIGAVPEPSSYALLGGLLSLGFVMLRRRA